MASAVETAVDTYIRLWSEHDAAVRDEMIAACFAEDGRLVSRGREFRGRAALARVVEAFLADPQFVGIRVPAVDAGGTTFRFRALMERRDGTTVEVFDAGEIDAAGRIALILTFVGAL